nr:cohesin domain-containing protein [Salinibacter ruber]
MVNTSPVRRALHPLALAGLLLVLCSPVGKAQVDVQLPDTTVAVGEEVSIPVRAAGLSGEDVTSYQFTVPFDGSVLRLTGASAEGSLTPSAPTVNAAEGELRVSFASASSLEGEGPLVRLTGEVAGAGTDTLQFSELQLFDSGGGEVPTELESGTVTAETSPSGSLGAPAGLSANPGGGQVELAWSQGAGGSPMGYDVYRSTVPFEDTTEVQRANEMRVPDTTYTDTDVEGGTEYYYRVVAVGSAGDRSRPSPQVQAALEREPETPSVDVQLPDTTVAVGEEVSIPVRAAGLSGEDVTSYQFTVPFDRSVLRLTGASAEGSLTPSAPTVNAAEGELRVSFASASSLEGEGPLVRLTGEVAGAGTDTLQFSELQLFDSGGGEVPTEPESGTVTARRNPSGTPPAPDSLVAGGGGGRVVLSWVDDDSTGGAAGYNVYRSTSSFGDKEEASLVNEGLVSGSPYTDTTAQRGKTYYYRITAANGRGGESGLSGEAIAKTLQEGIAVTVPDLKSDTGEVSTLSVEANLGTAETEGYTNLSFVFDSSVLNIVGVRGGDDLTFGPESPVYNQEGDTLRVSSASGSPPVTGQGELLQIDVKLTTDASTAFEAAPSNVSRENAVSIGPDGNIIPTSVFDDASSNALLLADSTGRGTVSFSESSGPPDPPAGLTVQLKNGTPNLSWGAPGSSDVAGYRVYRDTAPIDSSARPGELAPLDSTEASVTTYADSSGAVGTEYYYRVTAADSAANESSFSGQVRATPRDTEPPSAPAGLAAQADTTGQSRVSLRWSPPEAADLAGHRLYRSTASFADTSGADRIATLSLTDSVYVDTTATVGETYHYRVAAVDTASNQSGLSEEATATPEDRAAPSPPPSLAAAVEADSITLDWAASGSADTETYRVYRDTAPIDSSAGPAGLTPLDSVGAGTTRYADTTGTPGTEYHYRVTAVDTAANESGFSGEATATLDGVTPPSVPTGLAATAGGRQVSLNWDANTEADLAGYRLYRATSSFSDTTEAEPVTDSLVTGNSFTDTGLAAGTEQHYRVAAVDTAANQSGLSEEATATPEDRAAPSPPPSLAAEAGEEAEAGGIALSWVASDSADVEKYLLYRDTAPIDSSAGPTGLTPLDSVGASTTSYTDTTGAAGTEYYYRITAADSAANESGFSEEATATPTDVTPPPVPTGLAATAGGRQVGLSWASGTGEDLAGYRLYRSAQSPLDTSKAPLSEGLITGSTFTDTTAEVGEAYRYGATAVDTAGNESALSRVASAYLQPRAVEASVARSFGEASGPGDYRLVALPGAPDTSLASAVDGEAGAEWQAYREAGDDLRRYQGPGEEEFLFQKGRGYWLTSRQEWTLEGPVESAVLKDSTTAIPLNPGGWTIVANPFGEAVSFSALNRANGGDLQALWPFGGAFSDTSAVFKSARQGQAYYLFSEDPGRDSLQVPHPALTEGSAAGSSETRALQAASTKAASVKAASAKAAAPATIALSARPAGEGEMGPGATSTVRVGLAGERGPGTLRAPPGGLEAVSLRVVRGGQEESGQGEEKRLLMRDRRRAEGEGETFRLRLESQVEGPIRIQARGADSLGARSAALIDRSEKTTYDLSRDGPIQITPGQEKRRLEVAIGSESYVEGKREEAMPEEVRLTSYPNPAGRRATVEYALPEAREVTLQVYDVLGRRVATLEQGRKKAGRHTARLETGRLSSGVYFGRLEAGEQTRTQKITVVR